MERKIRKILINTIPVLFGLIVGILVQIITKSELLSIISVVIALFVIVGILVILHLKKPMIKITLPRDRATIGLPAEFQGTFENLSGKNLYLIHHPKRMAGDPPDINLNYYNNVLPTIIGDDNKGGWTCTAHVGLQKDNDREFEIFAIITEERPPVDRFLDVLPSSDAKDKIEVVRR